MQLRYESVRIFLVLLHTKLLSGLLDKAAEDYVLRSKLKGSQCPPVPAKQTYKKQ